MRSTLAEPATYAKKNLLPLQKELAWGAGKNRDWWHEPEIGPGGAGVSPASSTVTRRRDAGVLRSNLPADKFVIQSRNFAHGRQRFGLRWQLAEAKRSEDWSAAATPLSVRTFASKSAWLPRCGIPAAVQNPWLRRKPFWVYLCSSALRRVATKDGFVVKFSCENHHRRTLRRLFALQPS